MARKSGLIVVYNRIPALIAFVEVDSRAAVKKHVDRMTRRAKEICPKDTGELEGSIHSVSIEGGKSAEIQVDAQHAAPVEYGTYKMAAQPYLQPAVSEGQDEFFADVGKGMFARFS